MSDKSKPKILFVLGGPGSGKGTQCDIMKQKYGFKHFSIGSLLRQIIQSGSKDGQAIKKKMKEGQMVQSKPIVELLKKKILNLHKENKDYVYMIDGFPRNMENFQVWEKIIGVDFQILSLLFIECNNDVLVKRLIQRGKTSGRPDDNEQTIKKRMKTFQSQTQPIVKLYKQLYRDGKAKVLCVNGMFSIAQTQKSIKQMLSHHHII